LTENTQYTATWPTTFGSVCIVVGGLSLFGGCLSLTGMAEIEQLHTAIPFGEGELDSSLREKLELTAPSAALATILSLTNILLSLFLVFAGMSLLKRTPNSRKALLTWSFMYILYTFAAASINWLPRIDLAKENNEVLGMFLAQIMISMPLYLALPVFLLIYLNTEQVRNETSLWR